MIFDEVEEFYTHYKQQKCVIGYSFQGREIYAFHIGASTGKQFVATYAIHGREWITAKLALKHIEIGMEKGGGWIIPLLNPDGAKLSQGSYPLWKSNARGVDLNCNFDADWGYGRLNTKVRGAENCIGDYPFSEPETLAIKNFTLKIRPFVTLSFHTKGEEIYWEYSGEGDKCGGQILSEITGYKLTKIYGSAGGYKDWCIKSLKIPSYTIECGADSLMHPIKNVRSLKKCYKALKLFVENYG